MFFMYVNTVKCTLKTSHMPDYLIIESPDMSRDLWVIIHVPAPCKLKYQMLTYFHLMKRAKQYPRKVWILHKAILSSTAQLHHPIDEIAVLKVKYIPKSCKASLKKKKKHQSWSKRRLQTLKYWINVVGDGLYHQFRSEL